MPVLQGSWAHGPQLLNLLSRAHESQVLKQAELETVLHNKKSHHSEKPRATSKSRPCSLQLEKAYTQQWRPGTAKPKKIDKT